MRQSTKRWVALLMLGAVAVLAWRTIDPGRMLYLVWILLGGFAVRVLLTRSGSGYDKDVGEEK
ncbi:MAG TPA: hypothetical protein VGD64_05085 [Acidisarcina sp.]